jgi:hypothetical protein
MTTTVRRTQATGSVFAFPCDQPILMILALQRSGTRAMANLEPKEGKNARSGAVPPLTPWVFVRAAILANLAVAALVFIEFTVMSLVDHDARTFRMGLRLVPFVTLVIWSSATLFYVMALIPRWLGMVGRRLDGRLARSLPSDRFGVWDDWLDRPAPRGP